MVKKVHVMTRLEFELAHYDVDVQYVNHYATETPRSVAQIRFDLLFCVPWTTLDHSEFSIAW